MVSACDYWIAIVLIGVCIGLLQPVFVDDVVPKLYLLLALSESACKRSILQLRSCQAGMLLFHPSLPELLQHA